MQDVKVIRNYVNALFENASALGKKEEIFQHIKNVTKVIEADLQLKNTLYSPIISNENKVSLVKKLARTLNIDKILEDFLSVLIKNSRENILNNLASFYEQMLDQSNNIKLVKIKSSKTLEDDEKQTIKKYLETDLIKHKVQIKYEEDGSIIGGILIQYDNNIVDFSIAGLLQKIEDVTRKTIIE